MLAFSDLWKPLSRADVEAELLTIAASLGLPTTAWQAGGVGRTILAVVAQKISDLTQVATVFARSGFLELAEGEWLTLGAYYGRGVERVGAAAASGTLTLTNASAVELGPYAPGDLHFAHASTGKTYTNLASVTIAASTTTDIDIVADEAGTVGNAGPGAITVMVTPVLGVTCSNGATLFGSDEETDAALRIRSRAALGALSPDGPPAAYDYVARSAKRTDGTAIGVNRTRITTDPATGAVSLVVAGPSGPVDPTDVTRIDDLVQLQAVPLAVTATTASATEQAVAVNATVYVYTTANLTEAEAEALERARLAAYFQTLPIGGDSGGKVYRDQVIAELARAFAGIYHVTVTTPAADVTLAAGEVATFDDGGSTITVTLVSP